VHKSNLTRVHAHMYMTIIIFTAKSNGSLKESCWKCKNQQITSWVSSQRREDWQSTMVINSSLVNDPTVQLPGLHLPRCQWSLLNHFRTGHGRCSMLKAMEVEQTMKCVTAVTSKQCHISLIRVRWPNSTAVYNVDIYRLQIRTRSICWCHRAP